MAGVGACEDEETAPVQVDELGRHQQHFLGYLELKGKFGLAVLAGVSGVDGLAVVEDGDVGVEQHRVIKVLHGPPVLLKHSILLLLLVLLHVLGHLPEVGHPLAPDLLLKVLLLSKAQLIQVDLYFLDLDLLPFGVELFLLPLSYHLLLHLSLGFALYFHEFFDVDCLAFDIDGLFSDCSGVNFRGNYRLFLGGLLLEAFELPSASLAVEKVEDPVVAVRELEGTEQLTDKCERLVGAATTEEFFLFGLREEEGLASPEGGVDGGLWDCLSVGEAQVYLMFEGC